MWDGGGIRIRQTFSPTDFMPVENWRVKNKKNSKNTYD